MQQPEPEDRRQKVGRLHIKYALEAAVVVKPLVDHADSDDGVHQIEVPSDFEVGCKDQCDAVTDGKDGHKLGNVLERREEEHHAEQEQQVVVTGQHVACPQADVLQISAVKHALFVGL